MKFSSKVALGIFILIFILWRIVFLLYSQYVYDEEEAKTGSISVLLMHDRKLPILEHQPGDYEGGTLLFGILAIPFMWVFQKPYLGLKIMALTTALLLALFSVLWNKKLSGWPGAIITAILWIFAAPYIIQITFIPWGNYAETAMLSVLTFYLLHTILFEQKESWQRYILLGFFFGIGVWIHYGFLVTVFVSAIFIYLTKWEIFFSKKFAALATSAVIGFSPWIIYNATHHFWGISRFADGLVHPAQGNKFLRIAKRMMELFGEDIPRSLHLLIGDVSLTRVLSYLFYFMFLFLLMAFFILYRKNIFTGLGAILPKNQRVKSRTPLAPLVPVVYFFAYGLIYSFSEYGLFKPQWGTRDPESHVHIFVMLPAMIWICGLAAGKLWEKSKVAAIIPVAAMALLGFVGQLGLLDFNKSQAWRLESTFEGEKKVIFMEIGSKWGRVPDELDKIASKLDGINLASFYFGAGIKYGLDHVSSIQVALDKCAALEEIYLPYCHFGVGTGLYSSNQLTLEQFDQLMEGLPENVRPYILAGGAVGAIWFGRLDHPYLEKVKDIDFILLAPQEQKKELPLFIKGHLQMIDYRPGKE